MLEFHVGDGDSGCFKLIAAHLQAFQESSDVASLRALHVEEQLVEGMLRVYTLGHAFILDDVPALLCCGVLPHFKYQPVGEPLVQEIASNLVFVVPFLPHLHLHGGWVV